MDPIRRISRFVYVTLGILAAAFTVHWSGEDKNDPSAVKQRELELTKASDSPPDSPPTSPVPEKYRGVAGYVNLISAIIIEFSLRNTYISLFLKRKLLEPLKFRSNYVKQPCIIHCGIALN